MRDSQPESNPLEPSQLEPTRPEPSQPGRGQPEGRPSLSVGGILPGMAAISLYLLFVAMFNGFQMIRASGMASSARYSVLAICTLVVVGVFGMLRLRRWGWALVSGGCLLGAAANFFAFHASHIGAYLVQGLFAMVFFLYLARPEVRERMR